MSDDKNIPSVNDDVASILAELEAEIAEETHVVNPPAPSEGKRLTMLTKKGAPPIPALRGGGGGGGGLPGLPGMGGGPAKPKERVVLEGTLVADEAPEVVEDGVIRIIGRVSEDETECTLMVSRDILTGFSWHFGSEAEAKGSPLAERLMALPHVGTVLMDESTIVLTRPPRIWDEWEPIAKDAGQAIRAALAGEIQVVSDQIASEVPNEDDLRDQIQHILDTEVNPGVAAHEGHITLERVRGNSVYIKMGGGCQGCSVADVTLKQGIHGSFREAIPGIGAIYDETDHSAGLNPYFA